MSTGSEVAVRRPQGLASAIPAKLQYAHELAESGLLPRQYQQRPANVLWAVEYGEMLGLAPMAAMTGVHVIEGKPSASAGLISGLVRRAGHQLRVWGDNESATCTIVRSDDPENVFSVTWTLRKNADDNPSAEGAKLLSKAVWQQYPASMLKARAITQCARDACEEVLFGLHYTPEELGAEVDGDGTVIGQVVSEAAPQDDPFYVRAAPTAEDAWLKAALESAPGLSDLDACGAMWRKSVERVKAGELTSAVVVPLQDILRVRIAELKAAPPEAEAVEAEVVEGVVVLDPDDPWAEKVEEIGSEDDATAALTELYGLLSSGQVEDGRAEVIVTAILAKFPDAAAESQAAA